MPVCKKCGRFSNVLTIDVCEHCGAKDWMEESLHDKTLREHGERYAKMTPAQRAQCQATGFGSRVQTDTVQQYVGRAVHLAITSPAP